MSPEQFMWQSDTGLIRITFQIYLVNLILFMPCSPGVYFDNAHHLSQSYNLPIFCRFCLSLPHHLTSLNTTSAGHSMFATRLGPQSYEGRNRVEPWEKHFSWLCYEYFTFPFILQRFSYSSGCHSHDTSKPTEAFLSSCEAVSVVKFAFCSHQRGFLRKSCSSINII